MRAHAAVTHPDELSFDLLRNGFGSECYDGPYFFDTDQPVVGASSTKTSLPNFGGATGTA
jgi:phage major head subunit gpT-like protein